MGNLLMYITNVILGLLTVNTAFKLSYWFNTAIFDRKLLLLYFFLFGNSYTHECPLTWGIYGNAYQDILHQLRDWQRHSTIINPPWDTQQHKPLLNKPQGTTCLAYCWTLAFWGNIQQSQLLGITGFQLWPPESLLCISSFALFCEIREMICC